jgi:hypothetical protein
MERDINMNINIYPDIDTVTNTVIDMGTGRLDMDTGMDMDNRIL